MSTKFCGKRGYKAPQVIEGKKFNAKLNDIFCLGICLFMMIIGGSPWFEASITNDKRYKMFMAENGFKTMLKKWNKLHFVNDDLIDLLKSILQKQEINRSSIDDIKRSKFYVK